MKVCPLCHTKFEDDAEFCPKCKAQLEDLEERKKADAGGIPKSFWKAVAWMLGFILVMYFIYTALYGQLDLSNLPV